MKFNNCIRYVVILISIFIFCYQISIAWKKLISKPTVDKTEYISITDLESPPIMTFCPRQHIMDISKKQLRKWGYDKPKNPKKIDFFLFQLKIWPANKMELFYFMRGKVIILIDHNQYSS